LDTLSYTSGSNVVSKITKWFLSHSVYSGVLITRSIVLDKLFGRLAS
jgi:hypothetical protein